VVNTARNLVKYRNMRNQVLYSAFNAKMNKVFERFRECMNVHDG